MARGGWDVAQAEGMPTGWLLPAQCCPCPAAAAPGRRCRQEGDAAAHRSPAVAFMSRPYPTQLKQPAVFQEQHALLLRGAGPAAGGGAERRATSCPRIPAAVPRAVAVPPGTTAAAAETDFSFGPDLSSAFDEPSEAPNPQLKEHEAALGEGGLRCVLCCLSLPQPPQVYFFPSH